MRAVPEPEESVAPARRVRRVRTPQLKPRYVVDWGASWQSKFQLYLITCFLYYRMNRSVITNDEFDRLCTELASGWRKNHHQHKHLVTLDDLVAVTGYAIQYPRVVMGAASIMLERHREV